MIVGVEKIRESCVDYLEIAGSFETEQSVVMLR